MDILSDQLSFLLFILFGEEVGLLLIDFQEFCKHN